MRRREIELSVERELLGRGGSARRARLTARFELEGPKEAPGPKELAEAIRTLDRELEAAGIEAGFTVAATVPERSLEELVETYRPRQAELVDVLETDGEITAGEATLLRESLAGPTNRRPIARPAQGPKAPVEVSLTDRPLAAMPLANDRTPSVPRPIPDLLATYRIESIKQAGAVRARRQISFDEYMLLKRHFAQRDAKGSDLPEPGDRRT
ncbi:MAG: hypothetical protein L3J93_01125 [Thermoplasmata archaeon]|nr:hypothetical protein [Thermoplasmata archaeon]